MLTKKNTLHVQIQGGDMIKKINILISLLVVLSVGSVFSCDIDGQTGFMPENDLYVGVHAKTRSTMTKETFNAIIDRVDQHYSPIVKKRGGKLKWARKWDDGTVNASAQRFLTTYKVNMYGGLARHELVTDDAFAMVVCHELGHHLAGAPKVGGILMKWASNEGQSDYFASLKCFRRSFESDDNEAIIAQMKVPALVSKKCNDNYSDANDAALCVRISLAGKSLARLLGSLRGTAKLEFNTPDANIVNTTINTHPAAQCRLDTYFQGSLCDRRISDDVSSKDPKAGTCNRDQGYTDGVRPLCWFKPE
jgi:hypothetical protein